MPGINKMKKVNLSKKNKSKILLILRKTNERYIYPFIKKTTTNNQDLRLIVCLCSVDTTFIFSEKLFITSFSCQDKIDCSIKNLGVIVWTKSHNSKKESFCQNIAGIL